MIFAIGACASPAPTRTSSERASQPAESRGFKRIVATTLSELRVFILTENFAVAGKAEAQSLVHSGLTALNETLLLSPKLAEAVPSVENGLWKVLPEGRMETTWKIKSGARWHDGTPFTADDLVFTARVIKDKEMADLYMPDFDLIESAEAVDPQTVRVTWNRPNIDADQLFGIVGLPMPAHLLEQTYRDDKMSLSSLPYWSSGFIGTGPYKIKEWVLGSGQMIVSANDDYVLGRPKIDEIEVRMITDNNTMLANILASEIDITMGRNMSFEQAQLVKTQWKDGSIRIGAVANPMIIYPSFLYTDPLIVQDVRFRRALLQGINRQELADTLIPGLSSVAHSVVIPNDPDLPAIESSIVKYTYDPPASIRAIEGLGYTRGGDGMFRDASGQLLSIEMRTTSDNDIHMAAFYPVIDYIKGIGVYGRSGGDSAGPPARCRVPG
jgi:peptide/nickel transport system substrate-binding protein